MYRDLKRKIFTFRLPETGIGKRRGKIEATHKTETQSDVENQ